MANWNGNTRYYNVNGDTLNINTGTAPVGASGTSHIYDVTTGTRGVRIVTTMPTYAYAGNSYRFRFTVPTGAPVSFAFTNQSAREKVVTYVYIAALNKTTITIATGITNAGSFIYEIPGNPFNLTTGRIASHTVPVGSSWSLAGLVCYLPGTLIRTANGDRVVENLMIGDLIAVWDARKEKEVLRPVTWVGRGFAVPRSGRPDDTSQHPVRILKDAVSPDVPSRDLLVTSEHCVYLDSAFVPVRMLVNGLTIRYEEDIGPYSYYHIETEEHSILWANDLRAESYLDTGNRYLFRMGASHEKCAPQEKNWQLDSAAALVTERDFVEPLYRKLLQRARELMPTCSPPLPNLTSDPELMLHTDKGQTIRPMRSANGWVTFMVPSCVSELWIHSRVSRPNETIGPFVDDRRQLGVLIGQMHIFASQGTLELDNHLREAELTGWRELDRNATSRWTMGRALVRLAKTEGPEQGHSLLSLQILSAGPYVVTSARDSALSGLDFLDPGFHAGAIRGLLNQATGQSCT